MKKQLLLLLTALSCTIARSQYVNIPDTAFRSYLKASYPACFNAIDQMDTTCSAIVNATELIVDNLGIQDLDGLQYFKHITYLSCTNYPTYTLTNIPAFPATLDTIVLRRNSLTSVPPLPPSLKWLFIDDNQFTSLPPLPNTITYLSCGENNLTTLGALPDSLQNLYCGSAHLTSLPTLPATLTWLECANNLLQSLPTLPPSLEKLFCNANKIRQAPVFPALLRTLNIADNPLNSFSTASLPNLEYLDCRGDSLTSLPVLPNTLKTLNCSQNYLTSLPAQLPDSLNSLDASYNNLTNIVALPDSLKGLTIWGNPNLMCLPVLPKAFQYVSLDTLKIRCIPNSTSGLQVNGRTDYPICNITNNVNGCQAFPIIKGNVFYDFNSNGVKDAGDFDKKYGRVNLSNGTFTFTNDSGYYLLAPDTIGSFNVAAAAPLFFTAVPVSTSYNFSTYDTTVTQNIALQPTLSHDSVSVNLTALLLRARPGRSFYYKVNYKNAGSTNLPATDVILHYNGSLLTFNSTTNAGVTNAASTLTLHLASLPVGDFGDYFAFFTVKPTAALGSTIITDAAITSGANTGVDTAKNIITASHDPNDKAATPALTQQQVLNGAYIDYTIRFQNTGTDTAFHVVIADTLSNKIQANTFELISTSRQCIATVESNVVTFQMRNIMLPDSNTNERASHGYVRFRIKPVTSLVAGNTVPNKGSIYFDYNSPVVTNTAITQIISQVVPLKLIAFKGRREDNNITLYWQTNNEMNTAQFVVEQSSNGADFATTGTVAARGNGNNNYTYNVSNAPKQNLFFRLKMQDKDGSYTNSSIILIKNNTKAGFTLQQNPARNTITLTSINASLFSTEAMLINNVGAVVKQFTIHSATQIVAVNNLPAGVYYLKTERGNDKVVISR